MERIRTIPSHSERRRHVRKYSAGELTEEQSFYFRGPEGKLKIRAQNLALFLQLGEGVDEETWLHHFARGTTRAGSVEESRTTTWPMRWPRSSGAAM
jgi:hypothetical protein